MVNETTKAFMRRRTDNRFLTRWFVGDGIDIGAGSDSLGALAPLLPLVGSVRSWDIGDGDAMLMEGVSDESFDFVHSSHCLEHLEDPILSIRNWIRITKTGGHLVITVPDEDLYEQGAFPSTFNPDHKWTFTVNKSESWSPKSINVFDLLSGFASYVEILKLELVDAGFVYGAQRQDQTAFGISESAIEIVLKKRANFSENEKGQIQHGGNYRVLVKREVAMGDVIMVTPILKRLRSELGIRARIDVETKFPHVFNENHDVDHVNPDEKNFEYDRVINLDNVYEENREIHAIDAYMIAAFGDSCFATKETYIFQESYEVRNDLDWSKAITLNAGISHRNRTMPRQFWDALIQLLIGSGLTPIIVGRGHDESWQNTEGVIDLTNRLTIGQTASVIAQSACFVSSDTGAMHIAGSTLTPMVTIFTAVRAEHRMPWRKGALGWGVTPMSPALECIGCNGLFNCQRNDFACVEGPIAVRPEAVFEAIKRAIYKSSSVSKLMAAE